ncbi:MAG TPA: hypothetical protein VMU06_19705 [Stellaceae bacterium]|nr:hypothetical protein [Stellaceae bacterium]
MDEEKQAEPERIKKGRERLEEIERRIGRFMPHHTSKDGVKRGEWRSDYPHLTADPAKAGEKKKKRA